MVFLHESRSIHPEPNSRIRHNRWVFGQVSQMTLCALQDDSIGLALNHSRQIVRNVLAEHTLLVRRCEQGQQLIPKRIAEHEQAA